ncbi:hypothetical protein ACRQ5Q_14690 [Bradyrhizobium sp. PMVTL-01]|uniref:hypothetical protein n=1 Tax=Bradyrhizobium sp. PMVTL-01 TaxID=3434999 RepID=UPI003F7117D2
MSKFRIAFECSAAVGVEIEVDADNRDDAQRIGARWLRKNERRIVQAVDDLLIVQEPAVTGYAQVSKLPITHIGASLDEGGFELVDAFEPDSITS